MPLTRIKSLGITDGTIVNADINASAAIDSTKLSGITSEVKAWVNFNGTGTVAIRASFNVTSITDNNTGSYTVNFTNALSDANYAAVFGTRGNGSSTNNYISAFENRDSITRTTTALALYSLLTVDGTSGTADAEVYSVAILR
jgi:tetrahydromethanopterin S-methyltransferase subunit D